MHLANSKNRTANRRISKTRKNLAAPAKQSDSKTDQYAEQQTAAKLERQQTAAKIQRSSNSAGRLPAGGIRPGNTHCMIMLPT
jgi:hypothetical protein